MLAAPVARHTTNWGRLALYLGLMPADAADTQHYQVLLMVLRQAELMPQEHADLVVSRFFILVRCLCACVGIVAMCFFFYET